jgi:gas vesicle protein
MNTGKAVLGVLAGVAVGALLGVLFAPDKGSETRKKVFKKGSDTLDDLSDKLDDLSANISEKMDAVKNETHGFYEKAKSNGEANKKDVKPQTS